MNLLTFNFESFSMKILTAVFTLLLLASGAAAQDYPEKTIRLVNPFAPGGSTNVASRVIAQKLQELTGQPVVVDYKPGATGLIGSEFVSKAPPDGYTLLLASSSLAVKPSLYPSMPFDPIKDLAPIAILVRSPNVLAVHPSLPVRSVKELIEYAQARPNALNYASSGSGGTNHLGMELLKSEAKIKVLHVPFKGGGEAMTALLAGHVQMMFNPASTLAPQHAAGRLRMIAVASAERIKGLDLPTVAESGQPGFVSDVWFGFFAPAGTPAPVLARLNTLINRVLTDSQVNDTLVKAGLYPVGGSADDMRKLLAEETPRWTALVKATGLKIE